MMRIPEARYVEPTGVPKVSLSTLCMFHSNPLVSQKKHLLDSLKACHVKLPTAH